MLTRLDHEQIKLFLKSENFNSETKKEADGIIQKLLNEIDEKDKCIDSYKLRTEVHEFLHFVKEEEALIDMSYNKEITDLEEIKCIKLNTISLIEDGISLCSKLVSVDNAEIYAELLEKIEKSVFVLKEMSLPLIELIEKSEVCLEYHDQEIEMEF